MPTTISATIDSTRLVEKPNTMVATAKQRERAEQPEPAVALDRHAGEHRGRQQTAERGRAAQQARAPGADAEDVARIERQQRLHAAEQRGHELEQHGAEDGLGAAR